MADNNNNNSTGAVPQQQDVSQPAQYEPPQKRIKSPFDMQKWQESEAYVTFLDFILTLNESIKGKKLSDPCTISPSVQRCIHALRFLNDLIAEYPPIKQPTRFGNKAFKQWYDRMVQETPRLMKQILAIPPEREQEEAWKIQELTPYFTDSFGNATRIDYGTGHEAAFAAWMCCLAQLGVFNPETDKFAIVARLFPTYLEVTRNLQRTYTQEPAGSHGVWGLDDFQFLPFLWGAAQLIENEEIRPDAIHDKKAVERYKDDYMYFAAIKIIHEFKSGPFAEHSPILNDISAVKTWSKINSGLIKMYLAEVLHKLPVIQHFFFGTLLPFVPSKRLNKTKTTAAAAAAASGAGAGAGGDGMPTRA